MELTYDTYIDNETDVPMARPRQPRLTVEMLTLLLILALALVLRFRGLAQIEHNVDHAYPIWQAMTTLDDAQFPLAGQGTSVLFANPPLTGYLYLPVVALTRSPLGVYVFVIALNTLGVYLSYRATRGLLGTRLALIAAALLAVNPWMIEYARTSWVQSLLPFFVPAVAWLIWPVLAGTAARPLRRTALALVMAALLAHTYLLAFFIVAPLGLLIVLYRRRVPRRGVVIGGAVLGVLLMLYAIGLLGQLDDVRQRLANFSSGEAVLSLDAWEAAARLVTGAEYELARGLDAPVNDWEWRHSFAQPVQNMLQALIVLGMLAAVWAIIRGGERRDAAVIALVWFGLPVLAMSYTGSPVHPFYQIMGAPAGYILAAWGIGVIFRPETRTGAIVVGLVFVPFALLMSVNSARHAQATAATPGAATLYALPVGLGMQMGAAINQSLPDDPRAVAFAEAEQWIINSFAGELFPVWNGVRAPEFAVLPAAGGAYVTIDRQPPMLPASAIETRVFALPDSTLIVAALPPAADFDALVSAPELHFTGVESQQGITLIGYRIAPDDAPDQWRATVLFRVDAVAPEVRDYLYQPFIHAFDSSGARVVNVSGAALPGSQWFAGDMHRYEMTFTLPPGTDDFTVAAGLFDGGDGVNVIFLPENVDPTTAVPLPIIDG